VLAALAAQLLGAPRALAAAALEAAAAGAPLPPALIQLALAPNQALYDPADPKLRAAAALLQEGLNAPTVAAEEAVWTRIIAEYGGLDAPWVPDVVGRAWGNRGNARSRQGKLAEALEDYNTAIALCPWSPDPVLNRGVVLEALGRFPEACADYRAVLAVSPEDPSAWNNLGNASGGAGDWAAAERHYLTATRLAPQFSFAAANLALARYQLGRDNEAIKELRTLLRKYPEFYDCRAALAAALWGAGLQAAAEGEFLRVDDPRYRDLAWIKANRRWPPRLVSDLAAFLSIKDVQAR
jgi:tetratricopeptide (TPR) repeat protein